MRKLLNLWQTPYNVLQFTVFHLECVCLHSCLLIITYGIQQHLLPNIYHTLFFRQDLTEKEPCFQYVNMVLISKMRFSQHKRSLLPLLPGCGSSVRNLRTGTAPLCHTPYFCNNHWLTLSCSWPASTLLGKSVQVEPRSAKEGNRGPFSVTGLPSRWGHNKDSCGKGMAFLQANLVFTSAPPLGSSTALGK